MSEIIDLIYIVHSRRVSTMSVGVIIDQERDLQLGPVDANGGLTVLGKSLHEALPKRFPTEGDAEKFLTFLHVRNMRWGHNIAGQEYPYRVPT